MKNSYYKMNYEIFKQILNLMPTPVRWLNDFRKVMVSFKKTFGNYPNIIYPKTFNEKIAYRKLFDRRDIFRKMANKLESKQYVINKIGDVYVPDTLKVYDTPETFDKYDIDSKCVIKSDVGCGDIIIVDNPDGYLENGSNKRDIYELFNTSHGRGTAQWAYYRSSAKAFIEEYIEPEEGLVPSDVKLYMSYGNVKDILLVLNRFEENQKKLRFDPSGIAYQIPDNSELPKITSIKDFISEEELSEMKWVAGQLSKSIDMIRVDMYNVNGRILVGELTVYPWSGLYHGVPKHFDSDAFWPLHKSTEIAFRSMFKPTWPF